MLSTFLKTHEKLLICLAVIFLCFHLSNKYDNRKAAEDQQAAHTATITLAQQKQENATIAAQNQKLIAQLTAQVAQLQAANATLTSKESIDIEKVKNETASQVDTQLSQFAKQTIVPTSNGSSTLSEDEVKNLVLQLDQTVELKSELANEQTAVADLQKIETAQQTQITGLQAQLVDQTNACNAQITALKSKHRKSILKVIKYVGAIAFGVGMYAGHAL